MRFLLESNTLKKYRKLIISKSLTHYALSFTSIVFFLWFTYPENRMENDDGYLYAYLIKERPINSNELFSAKMTYYLPLCKVVYKYVSLISQEKVSAYMTMCSISIFFSAITLLIVYKLLREIMCFSTQTCILGCLFLLFSYGYWRYSTEADVYAISFFWLTLTYFLLSKEIRFKYSYLKISIIASLGVVFYKPSFIILFIIFPIVLIVKKQIKYLIKYQISGAFCIILFYLIGYLISQDTQSIQYLDYLFGGGKTNPGSPILSFFTLGSNIISANFIFGISQISNFIQSTFPYHIIDEEIFAASRNGILNYIAITTLIAFGIIFLVFFIKFIFFDSRDFVRSVHGKISIIWFALYGSVMAMLDPNAPEPWLLLLLPITFSVSYIFHFLELQKKKLVPFVIVILLFLHNSIGGIAIIFSEKGDYIKQQTKWLIQNSSENDLILTAGSNTMHRYLMYKAKAQTISLERDINRNINTINNTIKTGNIFLTKSAVNPNQATLKRSEDIKKIMPFILSLGLEPIENQPVFKLNFTK